jgi:hypothetical protein
MNEFEYKKSEHQLERSLLQKAIRRGNQELTEKVVAYLLAVNDMAWLKKRLYVITYEECWIYGSHISLNNNLDEYKNLAVTVKNKNAAGLAALAGDYNSGNYVPDSTMPEHQLNAIRSVANAIKNAPAFWQWVKKEPGYAANKNRIEMAEKAVSKAVFEIDKAMMYASAYLTVRESVPEIQFTQPINDRNFPYWIAIDKHTDRGRVMLTEAANRVGIDSYNGMILAFYLEGAKCNQISDSPYWDMISNWEFSHRGMTYSQAIDYWELMKPIIIDLTKDDVDKIKTRISSPPQERNEDQLSLF